MSPYTKQHKKTRKFAPDVLNSRKIESTIESIKSNCSLCMSGEKHECCFTKIINDWETLKYEHIKKERTNRRY